MNHRWLTLVRGSVRVIRIVAVAVGTRWRRRTLSVLLPTGRFVLVVRAGVRVLLGLFFGFAFAHHEDEDGDEEEQAGAADSYANADADFSAGGEATRGRGCGDGRGCADSGF